MDQPNPRLVLWYDGQAPPTPPSPLSGDLFEQSVFPIFLSSSFSVICSHTSLTETFPHSSHHRFTLRTPTKPLFGEGNVKKDSSTSTQF